MAGRGGRHGVVPDWWGLVDEWRLFTAMDPSGIMRWRREAFALKLGISTQTVSRADAARRFVERLARLGRIELADEFRHAPVTLVVTLARIERHSPTMVDELLSKLSEGRVSGSELLALERRAREEAVSARRHPVRGMQASRREFATKEVAPPVLAKPLDGYALRGREPDFSRRVIAAWGWPGSPVREETMVAVSADTLPPPLVLHALARLRGPSDEAYRGMRAYALGGEENDRRRLSTALLFGLATSRLLSEYWAVFERAADAVALTEMLRDFGAVGFGVARLDATGGLIIERTADRRHPPDLESEFSPRLRKHTGEGADTSLPPNDVSAPSLTSSDGVAPGTDTLLDPDKTSYAD